ncbi:sugar transferase [Metabacillus indicus]|uniref:Sugar transferase n=1 Tax=Metabacillus indicus TaxID=246786 RepID=A0A084H4G8_METID|nr:sugar transferase [Metabacillus indicus]KEZ50324.1 sugar transferase [Metabacillus indicus LMG 22858]KEZ54480.1 sugar transferase [Metabacillus indicus]
MKYFLDILIVLILITILFIFIIIISILVRIKLGSPILYVQVRPGLNHKPFSLYKFRTMTDEKDENGFLLSDEVRLTSFGKFLRKYSLDELPQLFNVLKGELSLVGPRPLLMEYLPLYTEEQAMRHQVKPGITGWAQVNGRNAISWEEKFELDVWYVKNRTLLLDMKILFLTFKKVIKSEGINQTGFATVQKFKGAANE